MHFAKTLGTACSSFAITNIDDLFVLVTFFAESSINENLTPLKITIGQYLGFSIIILVSMIGFAVAQAIPAEPIGFLGLLPILLGLYKLSRLPLPRTCTRRGSKDTHRNINTPSTTTTTDTITSIGKITTAAGIKSVISVASVSVMNGGDNISTYIPLFSQAKGAEIAVYVITYYILLGIWCLAGYLIMKQKHILAIAQKYAKVGVPLLYVGLGVFIIVKSDCYPWSIRKIDDRFLTDPGKVVLGLITAVFIAAYLGILVYIRTRKRSESRVTVDADLELQAVDLASETDKDSSERDIKLSACAKQGHVERPPL
ncbi:hypothetical protein H072_9178 [Dactylellina haptotyla CBS 200.50]|uniref:Cadmium resistance transporter n=1 Tax=Dactylellina haptotyla (strain CBS 200.50) TaxID=1284197 RepID=S8A375_DACHA|nr:hypothetical protein H072_9178 [Dactylellina haptotyla CBS 200.50]